MHRLRTSLAAVTVLSLVALGCSDDDEPAESPTEEPADDDANNEDSDDGEGGLVGSDLDEGSEGDE